MPIKFTVEIFFQRETSIVHFSREAFPFLSEHRFLVASVIEKEGWLANPIAIPFRGRLKIDKRVYRPSRRSSALRLFFLSRDVPR